jgi:hypothetical protein
MGPDFFLSSLLAFSLRPSLTIASLPAAAESSSIPERTPIASEAPSLPGCAYALLFPTRGSPLPCSALPALPWLVRCRPPPTRRPSPAGRVPPPPLAPCPRSSPHACPADSASWLGPGMWCRGRSAVPWGRVGGVCCLTCPCLGHMLVLRRPPVSALHRLLLLSTVARYN